MMQDWGIQIRIIYLNSRKLMQDTKEDWGKVFAAFQKVLDIYAGQPIYPDVMQDIQECILALERHLKGVE